MCMYPYPIFKIVCWVSIKETPKRLKRSIYAVIVQLNLQQHKFEVIINKLVGDKVI